MSKLQDFLSRNPKIRFFVAIITLPIIWFVQQIINLIDVWVDAFKEFTIECNELNKSFIKSMKFLWKTAFIKDNDNEQD